VNFRVVPNVREGILSNFERPRFAMGYATMEHVWDWLARPDPRLE